MKSTSGGKDQETDQNTVDAQIDGTSAPSVQASNSEAVTTSDNAKSTDAAPVPNAGEAEATPLTSPSTRGSGTPKITLRLSRPVPL